MKTELILNLMELVGLNPANVNERYISLYNRWKFDNSDEVLVDGKLINYIEKQQVKFGTYEPTPKKIIGSDLKDGFELTEKMFVEKMIQKLSNYSKADYPDDTWQMRVDLFLEYLKNKEKSFEPKSESEKVFVFTDYLKSNDNNAIIEKIKGLPRSKPKDIFIILKSLIDNGYLLFSKNEDMFNAYYNEFGYHKAYDSLKKALNFYEWDRVDKKHLQKIENMQDYLSV
jgi:hypothetical protein